MIKKKTTQRPPNYREIVRMLFPRSSGRGLPGAGRCGTIRAPFSSSRALLSRELRGDRWTTSHGGQDGFAPTLLYIKSQRNRFSLHGLTYCSKDTKIAVVYEVVP